MSGPKWIKPLFTVAGLYDGILGALFLMVPTQLFGAMNVTPPNHIGYVQFPAFLLIIFAVMFFNIAKDPVANRSLILYGILLKISYCAIVFVYTMIGQMPWMWIPFAYCDLVFLSVFIVARKQLNLIK